MTIITTRIIIIIIMKLTTPFINEKPIWKAEIGKENVKKHQSSSLVARLAQVYSECIFLEFFYSRIAEKT